MKNIGTLKQAIVRCFAISGFIIAIAFLIYRAEVFTPTMWPFQFLVSGITIGIAFTTFREKNYRGGIALLILWYLVLTIPTSQGNSWIFILEGVYAVIISAAVYLYIHIVGKSFIKNEIFRIITSTLIIGIFNSLIILVLGLYTLQSLFRNFPSIVDAMFLNLKIGGMLGLFMGVGIELSDYLIDTLYKNKEVAS
ncbi:MAG: hypothetical protein NTX44_06565 [Ignavibacteriales bacterium]|nr:hypothetical protein [Ignavibacteriales bacterium]